jgi:hypothetical protein
MHPPAHSSNDRPRPITTTASAAAEAHKAASASALGRLPLTLIMSLGKKLTLPEA